MAVSRPLILVCLTSCVCLLSRGAAPAYADRSLGKPRPPAAFEAYETPALNKPLSTATEVWQPQEVFVDEPAWVCDVCQSHPCACSVGRRAVRPLLWPLHDQLDRFAQHLNNGRPLQGTSWLNRPYHVDWFFGGMYGDELLNQRVDQGSDLLGGYRFGADFDEHWGIEARLAFTHLDLHDDQSPRVARTSENLFWDFNLTYYPWGDTSWKPYVSAGIGMEKFRFDDETGQNVNEGVFSAPIGVGLKCYYKNWLTLRLDVVDYISVAGKQINSMHNVGASVGIEWHFGGSHRMYYGW